MLLAAIVILFSLLALGLLVLLDRFDGSPLKAHPARHGATGAKVPYYDAFADNRESASHPVPAGRPNAAKRDAAA